MIVTISVLGMFGYLIVFASIASLSWKEHWNQTKEMLQMILPAVTGLIGSVTGFYFGTQVNGDKSDKSTDPLTGK